MMREEEERETAKKNITCDETRETEGARLRERDSGCTSLSTNRQAQSCKTISKPCESIPSPKILKNHICQFIVKLKSFLGGYFEST